MQPGHGPPLLSLLVLTLADAVLFCSLPRHKLSFGPVQTPLLGLALVRCILALLAAAVAGSQPALAWGAATTGQVLLWVLMAYGTRVEPFRLQVTHLEMRNPKLDNPGSPLRIVQLSDLHVERLTRRERRLPRLVTGLAPDLIVLTGDFLNTSYSDDERALADLRWLLARNMLRPASMPCGAPPTSTCGRYSAPCCRRQASSCWRIGPYRWRLPATTYGSWASTAAAIWLPMAPG